MTLGARIREERKRLGINQADFAALAGASRRAMANWEADETAPLVTALNAWATAGADAFYILTGSRDANALTQANDWLDAIERDLVDPRKWRLSGEDDDSLETRILSLRRAELEAFLHNSPVSLPSHIVERAQGLLNITTNMAGLTEFRARDFLLNRKRREQTKQQLAQWLNQGEWAVGDEALNQLTMLAIEYSVPLKELVELAVLCQSPAETVAAE